jgi:hypothetical protein
MPNVYGTVWCTTVSPSELELILLTVTEREKNPFKYLDMCNWLKGSCACDILAAEFMTLKIYL